MKRISKQACLFIKEVRVCKITLCKLPKVISLVRTVTQSKAKIFTLHCGSSMMSQKRDPLGVSKLETPIKYLNIASEWFFQMKDKMP